MTECKLTTWKCLKTSQLREELYCPNGLFIFKEAKEREDRVQNQEKHEEDNKDVKDREEGNRFKKKIKT